MSNDRKILVQSNVLRKKSIEPLVSDVKDAFGLSSNVG